MYVMTLITKMVEDYAQESPDISVQEMTGSKVLRESPGVLFCLILETQAFTRFITLESAVTMQGLWDLRT